MKNIEQAKEQEISNIEDQIKEAQELAQASGDKEKLKQMLQLKESEMMELKKELQQLQKESAPAPGESFGEYNFN